MIIIPDVHGRSFWKDAVKGRENEEIIFLGDYVDPYVYHEDINYLDGMTCLLEVIEFKKQHMDNVTLLLGNHDLSYITTFSPRCRFDYDNSHIIRKAILDNISLFSIASLKTIGAKQYIFSHAGILQGWVSENVAFFDYMPPREIVDKLNAELATGKVYRVLGDISYMRGGEEEYGSCVWADVDEHIKAIETPASVFAPGVYQVFGHTMQVDDIPLVNDHFACLDCRKAFVLDDNGKFSELKTHNL